MKKLFTGLSLAVSVVMTAQKAPAKNNKLVLYSYQTFGCDNKGYFDSSQYKKEEIDGTYKLLYPLSWSPFSSLVVFNLTKLDLVRSNSTLLLQQVESEYQERKKELNDLKVIDLPVWKKKQADAKQLLGNEYQLRKEVLMAYSDPKSLQKSIFYNTCKEYIDAITTDDKEKTYTVWKSLFETKNNEENSIEIKNAFTIKWNDERKADYALIDLINAFHNCANHSFRTEADEEDTMFKAFDQIFTKLKMDCDEP
ncbi:hypothetical protein [Chryseobacterium sp.]|uniref:hypothetical protein n=1 Tax=Chryseobacterium sp. TaxID=1871047 RepID=UPI0025BADE5F|nr:hypothetical protein [Chryseobacterium sp.]MBV8327683.1 hypothetical protein [Chryseobacterium sp.]